MTPWQYITVVQKHEKQ